MTDRIDTDAAAASVAADAMSAKLEALHTGFMKLMREEGVGGIVILAGRTDTECVVVRAECFPEWTALANVKHTVRTEADDPDLFAAVTMQVTPKNLAPTGSFLDGMRAVTKETAARYRSLYSALVDMVDEMAAAVAPPDADAPAADGGSSGSSGGGST